MARIRQGTVNIAQVIYVDPVSGEITDASNAHSIQAKAFYTPNYELSDAILGVYRGTALSIANDQPLTPQEGDRLLVGTVPTGSFIGWANQIIEYRRNSSNALIWAAEGTPKEGTLLYVQDPGTFYRYANNSWVSAFGGSFTRETPPTATVYTAIYETKAVNHEEPMDSTGKVFSDNFASPENALLGEVKVQARVSLAFTGSAAIGCRIKSDASGYPGTLLTTADNVVLLSSMSTTSAEKTFNFTGLNLVQGTAYWVELYYADTGGLDGTHYAYLGSNLDSVGGTWVISSDAVTQNIGGELYFKIYRNDGTGYGSSASAGQIIRANSAGYLDASFLQYNVDFGTNKPRLNPTYTATDTYVFANKGYVDGVISGFQPGVLYNFTSAVTRAGMLVRFASADTVAPLDITTSQEAIGLTLAPSGVTGKVVVLANDNEVSLTSTALETGETYTVGQRIYWLGNNKLSKVPPTDPGTRVWQVGVISDPTAGAVKMHVQVAFKKVNA